MKVNQQDLAKILSSRDFYASLKSVALFTLDTDKEAEFIVVKKPNYRNFRVSEMTKGTYDSMAREPHVDLSGYGPPSSRSWETLGDLHDHYDVISIHTHSEDYGPIVPSITVYDDMSSSGDLEALRKNREGIRMFQGYDVRPIKGVAQPRSPTQIDLLLVQETKETPLGLNDLFRAQDAVDDFNEYETLLGLEESYHRTQEVVEALKATGLYSAQQIRYRNGRPLKEDLEKLVHFEFDEVRLPGFRSPFDVPA